MTSVSVHSQANPLPPPISYSAGPTYSAGQTYSTGQTYSGGQAYTGGQTYTAGQTYSTGPTYSGASYSATYGATIPTYGGATTTAMYSTSGGGAGGGYEVTSGGEGISSSLGYAMTTGLESTGGMASSFQQHRQFTGEATASSRMITGNERVQSVRKISSTIIGEEYIGPRPQDMPTREVVVEVPPVEEVKRIPVYLTKEKEKRVPKYETVWVEKIVEVPRVKYIDKQVEKINVVVVPKEVKVPKVVDRPYEVVKEVKVPQVKYVEKIMEIPEIIEVPQPYEVKVPVPVNQYTDKQVPLVVAQTIKPYIVESKESIDVDVLEYEPEFMPIDVQVIKPVSTQITAAGAVDTLHRVITVPAAQYNTMLQQLNVHLNQEELRKLPFIIGVGGQVQFLSEKVTYTQPQPGVEIQGYIASQSVTTHTATMHPTTYSGTFTHGTGGTMIATGGGTDLALATTTQGGATYSSAGGQQLQGATYSSAGGQQLQGMNMAYRAGEDGAYYHEASKTTSYQTSTNYQQGRGATYTTTSTNYPTTTAGASAQQVATTRYSNTTIAPAQAVTYQSTSQTTTGGGAQYQSSSSAQYQSGSAAQYQSTSQSGMEQSGNAVAS